MAIVLALFASPRGAASVSTGMANAFLDHYQKRMPDDKIPTFNVFDRAISTRRRCR